MSAHLEHANAKYAITRHETVLSPAGRRREMDQYDWDEMILRIASQDKTSAAAIKVFDCTVQRKANPNGPTPMREGFHRMLACLRYGERRLPKNDSVLDQRRLLKKNSVLDQRRLLKKNSVLDQRRLLEQQIVLQVLERLELNGIASIVGMRILQFLQRARSCPTVNEWCRTGLNFGQATKLLTGMDGKANPLRPFDFDEITMSFEDGSKLTLTASGMV